MAPVRSALVALVVLISFATGCASRATSERAERGVRAYLAALRSNNPKDAYRMLSESTRKRVSFDEFALQWKQSELERKWQADALEASLKGKPDAGERARINFSDGKLVQLERDGTQWRLESELVSRSRAKRPRDAIRIFADAISARDVPAAMAILSKRRREGISKQVEGFVAGIGKHVTDEITENSDRAELRWDDESLGLTYRIVIVRESDTQEWRIDDIYIRPTSPKDEEVPERDEPSDSD